MTVSVNTRRSKRSRRGVTLVLVTLLIVVLVGMVGVVLDFGRFYAYRVQMQTTADAVALSGAQELARNSPATAADSALDYVPLNVVDGVSASVPKDSVRPGIWNFASAKFTPTASFTTAGVNAVTVDVRHSAAYTFGRVWERTNIGLHTTATAAVGFVNTTSCVRPWAVSYQSLLDVLYPPAGSKSVTYSLTAADISALTQEGSTDPITLKVDVTSPVTPGSIGSIQTATSWTNANSYEDALDGPCPDLLVGVGSTVSIDPFQGPGRTQVPLSEFCNARGGISGTGSNFTCLGAPRLKLVLWDTNNGNPGNGLTYNVKYVGAFAVTGFHTPGGKEEVTGYFSTTPSLGAVGTTPSPLLQGILVR